MVEEGDRIELVHTADKYTLLGPGDEGTVTRTIGTAGATGGPHMVTVNWDSGSNLTLIEGKDEYRIVY
jgi:hypothetical protein